MNTIELPPGSISIDDFSAKSRSMYNGIGYQAATSQDLKRLSRAYYLMDPLLPFDLSERDGVQLATALDMSVSVCESTLDTPRRMTTKRRDAVRSLCGDLLLDKATVSLANADPDYKQLAQDMERAEELFAETTTMQNPKRRYTHHGVGSLLGNLSARTTGVYIDAKQLEQQSSLEQNYGKRILLKRRLAGIAIESIEHMTVYSEALRVKKGQEVGIERGRFMEMTAFTQKMMAWSEKENPADSFVRFALDREDHPRATASPKRSFDLLTYEGEDALPVQVKTVGGQSYHPSIAVWRPVRVDDIFGAPSLVVDTFRTVADASADYLDVRNARQLIQSQFVQIDPAAEYRLKNTRQADAVMA